MLSPSGWLLLALKNVGLHGPWTVFTPTVAVAQQHVLKVGSGDFLSPQAGQVFGRDLAVGQAISPALQLTRQGDGGNLGGVGLQAEHGLTKEQAAGGDAVESSHQFPVTP